jgi:hypothetical protein
MKNAKYKKGDKVIVKIESLTFTTVVVAFENSERDRDKYGAPWLLELPTKFKRKLENIDYEQSRGLIVSRREDVYDYVTGDEEQFNSLGKFILNKAYYVWVHEKYFFDPLQEAENAIKKEIKAATKTLRIKKPKPKSGVRK